MRHRQNNISDEKCTRAVIQNKDRLSMWISYQDINDCKNSMLVIRHLHMESGLWFWLIYSVLIHWGRATHICVNKRTIIGSDKGLSPGRRRAIIRTNAGILLIRPLGTNFSEILVEIQTFSLKKIRLKMSSAKCCSFRLGLNVLMSSCYLHLGLWLLITGVSLTFCRVALSLNIKLYHCARANEVTLEDVGKIG